MKTVQCANSHSTVSKKVWRSIWHICHNRTMMSKIKIGLRKGNTQITFTMWYTYSPLFDSLFYGISSGKCMYMVKKPGSLQISRQTFFSQLIQACTVQKKSIDNSTWINQGSVRPASTFFSEWEEGDVNLYGFGIKLKALFTSALQIFTPWKLRGPGIMGSLQGKPALSMEKGCKNHKETLCMTYVVYKLCNIHRLRGNPMIIIGSPGNL